MHKFLFSWLAVAWVALLPLQAAQVHSFNDGLKRAGDDKPFVMFCYGANYDQYSEQVYEKFIKRNTPLSRMVKREVFLVVPVYQQPTDNQRKEFEKVMSGRRGVPGGIWSYPCLAVLDGKGNFRGAVQSGEDFESPEKAAEALSVLLEDFRKQQKLLERAGNSKGNKSQELMQEALNISRVNVPGHGTFDPANNGLGEKLQLMDIVTANAHVRSLIANGKFTLIERQMILVALAGHMRRKNAAVHRMRAIYTEIRNIDPNSIYGAYADGALQLWVIPRESEKPAAAAAEETKG
ncbi:MAG: hypothetical protein J1E42_07035 [Akkermansiaceae bacterium]|nr:hypothetical protein [Akkermansiaceae bacterium]